MATPKNLSKPKPHISKHTLLLKSLFTITTVSLLFLYCYSITKTGFSLTSPTILKIVNNNNSNSNGKYLYWGNKIDCPGKHCYTCAGLGHQESSLRCALEEALFLQRTFVMPARMCINPTHNKKGMLHQSNNADSDEGWMATSCAMDSLYDLDLLSRKIPVILDNSMTWQHVLATSMKLGLRGVAHVEGVSRLTLKEDTRYSNILLINRTANPLAWFTECKDRKNHSSIMLPYDFLPSMAAKKLRDAADKIKAKLGDYDAIHVRRGDILKTRKDRFGVERSKHPHVERDTRPDFILRRIAKWVPPGWTLYIASNERKPGFFSPLGVRYKMAYSSNFSTIIDPVIENNYQLFMIERLIMMGAKTFINTFKTEDSELSLTDDIKKNPKNFLFTSKEDNAPLKAIDFGLSDYVKPDERLNDIVGSAYYVAPEVLHRCYGTEADMWSIGVIAYILLCGSRPFWARTESGIFRAVLKADPSFDEAPWPSLSPDAIDFVKRLLNKDYRKRLTASQALSHPWLMSYRDIKVPQDMIIYRLVRAYICSTALRKAALRALAKTLTVLQLSYLKEQFQMLCPTKNGYISLQNFKTAIVRNGTDAMKDSRVIEFVNMVSSLHYKKMDFEEFCAAAISVHQLEAMDTWEQHARRAYELFEKDGNRAIMIEELASELGLSPSVPVHVVLQDWIRHSDGKLSFLGFVRLLHGLSSRAFQKL